MRNGIERRLLSRAPGRPIPGAGIAPQRKALRRTHLRHGRRLQTIPGRQKERKRAGTGALAPPLPMAGGDCRAWPPGRLFGKRGKTCTLAGSSRGWLARHPGAPGPRTCPPKPSSPPPALHSAQNSRIVSLKLILVAHPCASAESSVGEQAPAPFQVGSDTPKATRGSGVGIEARTGWCDQSY